MEHQERFGFYIYGVRPQWSLDFWRVAGLACRRVVGYMNGGALTIRRKSDGAVVANITKEANGRVSVSLIRPEV